MYSAMLAKFHHTKLCHIPRDLTFAIALLECLVSFWLAVVVYFTLSCILRITLTHITIIQANKCTQLYQSYNNIIKTAKSYIFGAFSAYRQGKQQNVQNGCLVYQSCMQKKCWKLIGVENVQRMHLCTGNYKFRNKIKNFKSSKIYKYEYLSVHKYILYTYSTLMNFQQFCYVQDQDTKQPFCTLYFTP